MIKIEGNFDTSNSSSYYSNFTPGYSDYYEASFIPMEAGMQSGTIIITFEDDAGERIEETVEFQVNVDEEFIQDYGDMSGMDTGVMRPMTPDAEQSIFQKILGYFKNPWVIGGSAGGVLIIIVVIILLVRRARKQRRSLEFDE